ncbi:hypothetical protein JRQ81_004784, partial [Phrynocephalus forsythii]
SNDLTQLPGKSIILQIITDLWFLKHRFPEMHLICSEILPQMFWRGARTPHKVDCTWKRVNREVGKAMQGGLGGVICHLRSRFKDGNCIGRWGSSATGRAIVVSTGNSGEPDSRGWLAVWGARSTREAA